ncbi:B12-binding domain-containing radical SAM protein [Vallitalea pronyensis]|uniref:B12-binding domain-containing radical SAM protein n=1 Tax=Vallitalea pronyensis TaxID=1348613 RepID=A0A8J8SFQ7_9FIRM|nr:radical SAM protein [Vallitalea pronyensis]QUI21851.1 B12-binding domain-containing radical SAM protein [Vallitalea pronyensis]
MKICLINPPYFSNRFPGDEYSSTGFTIPHIGIGYISAILNKHGFHTEIIESMGQNISMSKLRKILKEKQYDVVGISTCDNNRYNSAKILHMIKSIDPKTFVFLGGYTPTLTPEETLRNFEALDCCVIGEGEYTVLELMKTLKAGGDYREVSGIAYLEEKEYIQTKSRPLIQHLDELPFPDRPFYSSKKEVRLLSTRGCPNHCNFCAITSFYKRCPGKKFRIRSAENIIEEIEYLIKKYERIDNIHYNDDSFLTQIPKNLEKIEALYQLLKAKNIMIPFQITVCAKDMKPSYALLKKLKEVGLYHVFIGIESFSQRQLDYFQKNVTVKENMEALEVVAKLKIKATIGFIPLDPYVTIQEVRDNFTLLKQSEYRNVRYEYSDPFSNLIHMIAVAGTPFRGKLEEEGLYIMNEQGYEFCDRDVQFLNVILIRWNTLIKNISYKYYYIILSEEKGNMNLSKVLKDKMTELFDIYMDFAIHLCDGILSRHVTQERVDAFFDLWAHKANRINVFFDAAKLEIDKL